LRLAEHMLKSRVALATNNFFSNFVSFRKTNKQTTMGTEILCAYCCWPSECKHDAIWCDTIQGLKFLHMRMRQRSKGASLAH